MERWISSFILGCILSLFLPRVPVLFCLILWGSLFALSFKYTSIKFIVYLFLGVIWINTAENVYQTSDIHFTQQENNNNKEGYLVSGYVVNIPKVKAQKQYFNFNITQLNNRALSKSILVRLSWKDAPHLLQQGEQWQFKCKLKAAHGFANIGGFNYVAWLRHKGILATGYVINAKGIDEAMTQLLHASPSLRHQLYNQVTSMIKNKPLASLVKALSFGERGDISDKIQKILQTTATQHLIAISGLHLGLVASGSFIFICTLFQFFPVRFIPTQLGVYLLNYNTRFIAVVFSLLLTYFYAYISGFALPTLRALSMIFLYWFLRGQGLKVSWLSCLLFIVLSVVLFWPFSLLSMSFWLSFYAVVVIFLINWRFLSHQKKTTKFKQWLTTLFILQLSLSLLLLPLTLFFTFKFSFLAIIANLISVPWMSITAIPLCLMGVISIFISPVLAAFFFNLAHTSLSFLWHILTFLSEQSWAVISLSTSEIWCLIAVIFVCIYRLLLAIPLRKLDGAFIVLLLSLWGYRSLLHQDDWFLTVLDVGQGLSVVIEKKQHTLLYDTGAKYPGGFSLVEAVVLPYFKAQGIHSMDTLIISHNDNDHAGGVPLLQTWQEGLKIMANDPAYNASKGCEKGESFYWQSLKFDVLWPLNKGKGRENEDSCVIKISDGKSSILLTGDITIKVEKQLLAQGDKINADVLIVPHHGSKTSSSDLFIKAVSPKVAVFSVGFQNRWNMPHREVISRYQYHKVELLNTAKSGMIRFNFSPSGENIKLYHEDIWPFWFTQ